MPSHPDASNLYAPPAAESPAMGQESLRELVVGWEKRRIRYNLILLPFGCVSLFAWTSPSTSLDLLIFEALLFAIGANFAYLAGPLGELYLRALLNQSQPRLFLRKSLYWAGVFFSIAVILLAQLPVP